MDPGDDDPNKAEAQILLVLENFAQYGAGRADAEVMSATVHIRGLPWRMMALFANFNKQRWLGLFLQCTAKNADWSCRANAVLRLHAAKKGVDDKFLPRIEKNFYKDNNDFGVTKVVAFEELMNPENGWIDVDGTVTVSARVKAEPAHGIQTVISKDNIRVNGMLLSVNKHQLLLFAPCLERYFAADALQGIQLEEPATLENFKQMIALLPPNGDSKVLDDECIEGVMHLANQFAIGYLEGLCRHHLLAKECKKSHMFKYRMATKYGFDYLKSKIMSTITRLDVESNFVENLAEYAKLGADAADALNDRLGLIFGGQQRGGDESAEVEDGNNQGPAHKRARHQF